MADHIKAKILRNADGLICGFDIKDHGDPIVCSGVSVLTMNTVNSLEAFTSALLRVDYDESGEIAFTVDRPEDEKVRLLMESLELGLRSIEEEYNEDIHVFEEVYQKC